MTITLTKSKLAIAVLAVAMLVPATAWANHVFTDVPDDKFYAVPVEWAFDNGITTGKSPSLFAPDDNVTRGESVTFLKRYEDNIAAPADNVLQEQIDLLAFALESLSFETYTNSSGPVFASAGPATTVFTVACDDGDRATGGGFSDLENSTSVLSSYQDPVLPDTWHVKFFNPTDDAADRVEVHVTCLRFRELN